MADDGMLLNFDIGDQPYRAKPVFTGGTWKDRLKAKRSAQRRPRQSRREEPAPVQEEYIQAGADKEADLSGRPTKRQKTSAPNRGPRPNSTANGEVISSLFSYNPTSKSVPKPAEREVQDAAPSNAPLIDGIDTFTSLGLSAHVAAHLLTKLNLEAPTAIQKSTLSQLINDDSDAFIQAETGSGKTLAYLLPLVDRIITYSRPTETGKDGHQVGRTSGLFAIILAPTRELCKQILVVLESLLRCAHWIVAGAVLGGEKKKSEKARLRKGLNILVATPGRLADHLQNTEVLDTSDVKWLVLDEGDRLMELGFEEEIKGIVAALGKKRDTGTISNANKVPLRVRGGSGLPARRVTILCSATMRMNVQRLGEISLKDAVHIQANKDDKDPETEAGQEAAFTAPAQLKQSYVLVPPKQRLVTLAAMLKRTFSRKGSFMKAIVFFSCADSVDFHFEALSRPPSSKSALDGYSTGASKSSGEAETVEPLLTPPASEPSSPLLKPPSTTPTGHTTSATSPLLTTLPNPPLSLFRLHGSLTQPVRTSTLRAFSKSTDPAVLLCTDVASRGLDLPSIDLVIEYDPAFSAEDHLHRIGRTARAGKAGKATVLLMPGPEEGYVEAVLEGKATSKQISEAVSSTGRKVAGEDASEVLKRAFGKEATAQSNNPFERAKRTEEAPAGTGWEQAATNWQLDTERWVLESKKRTELARRAFISHVRAYATHTVAERGMFDVKSLHLGHLAKAFGLRDRPGNMGRGAPINAGGKGSRARSGKDGRGAAAGRDRAADKDHEENPEKAAARADRSEAMRKMRRTMKAHMTGANEFNIG